MTGFLQLLPEVLLLVELVAEYALLGPTFTITIVIISPQTSANTSPSNSGVWHEYSLALILYAATLQGVLLLCIKKGRGTCSTSQVTGHSGRQKELMTQQEDPRL